MPWRRSACVLSSSELSCLSCIATAVAVVALEQGTGGFEPRFNPGSNSGAGSEGGKAEYQHQEPGFKPRFNPGSTQVQPRFNPG